MNNCKLSINEYREAGGFLCPVCGEPSEDYCIFKPDLTRMEQRKCHQCGTHWVGMEDGSFYRVVTKQRLTQKSI